MPSRRTFLSQLAVLAAAGAGAWWLRDNVLWPAPRPVFADGAWSGWLPFADPAQGLAIVTARVNGRPVEALLDSGAQTSVLDQDLAMQLGAADGGLGPVIVAFGVSGGPQFGRAASIDVGVGGLALPRLRTAVFPLARIAEASRRPFGLILGQDVLNTVVADVDFPAARLAFRTRQGHVPAPDARPVPARRQGRQLLVPVAVEGAPLELVLDTGASNAVALSQQAAETAGLLNGRPVSWTPAIGFGGVSRDRVVPLRSFTFAGQSYTDVPAHIYSPGRGSPLPTGLLGVQAYDRFRLILDIGGAGLALAPSAAPRRERPRTMHVLRLAGPRR